MKAFFVTLLLFVPSFAIAQGLHGVIEGMSFPDVIRRAGIPVEKIEREASRITVWRYRDGTIHFREGRVVARAFADSKGTSPLKGAAESIAVKPVSPEGATRPRRETELTEALANEFINAIPEDSSPSTPGGAAALPQPGRPERPGSDVFMGSDE